MATETYKLVDPMKVANLNDNEYNELYKGVSLIKEGIKEENFPTDLYVSTFTTMRKLRKTVNSYHDMQIVALQLIGQKLLIDRLRVSNSA